MPIIDLSAEDEEHNALVFVKESIQSSIETNLKQ